MTPDIQSNQSFTDGKYDAMQNLTVIRDVRSGYCWTKRHKKCKHTSNACYCRCHQ